jgi:hypothetical protein
MINSSTTPQQLPDLDDFDLAEPEDFDPWPTATKFVEELVGNELRNYVYDAQGQLLDAWSVTV